MTGRISPSSVTTSYMVPSGLPLMLVLKKSGLRAFPTGRVSGSECEKSGLSRN